MNNCNFTGRLTKDPELKQTASGTSVATFTLAVDRKDKDKNTDFIPCKAWSKTAETIANYLHKGSLIAVVGRLETRSYDKDGEKRYIYEIIVTSFDFLERRSEAAASVEMPPVVDEALLPFSLEG